MYLDHRHTASDHEPPTPASWTMSESTEPIGYTFPFRRHKETLNFKKNSTLRTPKPISAHQPTTKTLLLLVPPDRNEHKAHMSGIMSNSLRRSPAILRPLWTAQARQLHSSGTASVKCCVQRVRDPQAIRSVIRTKLFAPLFSAAMLSSRG